MKCRTCFKRRGTISLWDKSGKTNLTKQLLDVTGVTVIPNDGLPDVLCKVCSKSLNAAYKFRMQTQKIDRELKNSDFFDSDLDIKPDIEFMNDSKNDSTKRDPLSPERSVEHIDMSPVKIKDEFPSLMNLDQHIESNTFLTINQTSENNSEITTKRKSRNVVKRHKCERCPKRFHNHASLKAHERKHTGKTLYSCTECPKSFSQPTTLKRHQRTHTGDKPYICETCGKKFASKYERSKHQTVHSEDRKFTCDVCKNSFKSKQIMLTHIKSHYDDQTHICDICGSKSSSKGNLKTHMIKVHTDKSGQCDVCHKLVSNLNDHMVKHTGETPFQCNLCTKSFSSKSSLSLHLYNHKNQGRYACNVGKCTKTFAIKSSFIYHTLKCHSEQTPYVCLKCDKKYFRYCDLIKHTKLHNENK